jgi:hypothetical protein
VQWKSDILFQFLFVGDAFFAVAVEESQCLAGSSVRDGTIAL